MALDFERRKINFEPAHIDNKDITSAINKQNTLGDSLAIADKLMAHLAMVQEFRDRVEAVDYLIDNAEKMAGNPTYKVLDESMQRAVKAMGGDGTYIDFSIFKEAVKTLKQSYEEIALVELTGVRND